MSKEVASLLMEARSLIELGWSQEPGAGYQSTPPYSLDAAIWLVSRDTPFSQKTHNAIKRLLGNPRSRSSFLKRSIASFNDKPKTAKTDVLKILDRAIEAE